MRVMPAVTSHVSRSLEAVLAMGQVLATTAPYEQVVARMVAMASDVLNVETCGFFLHDTERDELVLQRPGFDAYDEHVFAYFHIPLSRPGPTRQVFLSHRPALVNDALEDPSSPWFEGCKLVNARTLMVVPLMTEGRGIGVLSIINKRIGVFDSDDLDLAMQIAPHLALAIDAAAKHRLLEEQQRQLDRALAVHAELSKAIVNAPNVGPVAESLARFLGRPVVVLDAMLRVLVWAACSDVTAPREQLESPLRNALEPLLDDRPELRPVRLRIEDTDAESVHCVVAPVAAGEHVEGYLVVFELDDVLDRVDARALEHAATLVAFQLLRERTALEVERRLRGELFQELLSTAGDTELGAITLLERLGAGTTAPWRVARIELSRADVDGREPSRPGFDPRLTAALSIAWSQAGVSTALVPWRSGFACVVPENVASALESGDLVGQLRDVLRTSVDVGRPELCITIALGAPAHTPGELARSLRQAEDALALATRLGLLDQVVPFEELAVERVLIEAMDASPAHQAFVDQVLGPLSAYDAAHHRDLLATLRTHVAMDYSPRATAGQLFIHTNTVHFRLRRITELLGGSWPHGEQRFRVELALRLSDLLEMRARSHARERTAHRQAPLAEPAARLPSSG
jgi:hypothetical protein